MNILWLLLGGIITAIEYIIASLGMMITIIGIPFGIQTLKLSFLALCPCITIIGIPFGRQHFKLAGLALTPFGKHVVEK